MMSIGPSHHSRYMYESRIGRIGDRNIKTQGLANENVSFKLLDLGWQQATNRDITQNNLIKA